MTCHDVTAPEDGLAGLGMAWGCCDAAWLGDGGRLSRSKGSVSCGGVRLLSLVDLRDVPRGAEQEWCRSCCDLVGAFRGVGLSPAAMHSPFLEHGGDPLSPGDKDSSALLSPFLGHPGCPVATS